mgnify:CR=1 FL=1
MNTEPQRNESLFAALYSFCLVKYSTVYLGIVV